MNPTYRAAIFDMDGTLIDSLPVLLKTFCKAYRNLTGGRIPASRFKHLLGEPLSMIAKEVHPDDYRAYMEEFARLIAKENAKFKFFPGVRRMLASLNRRGIKLAIVSGIRTDEIRIILRANRALKFFPVIVSAKGIPGGKGEGKPFLRACRKMGVKPSETAAAGDTALDCRGASRAGCLPVAIKNRVHSVAELKRAGAKVVLKYAADIGRFF